MKNFTPHILSRSQQQEKDLNIDGTHLPATRTWGFHVLSSHYNNPKWIGWHLLDKVDFLFGPYSGAWLPSLFLFYIFFIWPCFLI